MEIVTYTLRFAARSFAQLGTPHGIVMALASVVGYFLPEAYLQDCAIAAIGLIVFDALTAMAAAYLTGEAISSAKAGRTLSKFVIYFCLVGAISLAFKTVPELVQVRPRAVQVILIWVILRETISIIENADKANIRIPKALRNIVRDASKRLAKEKQTS